MTVLNKNRLKNKHDELYSIYNDVYTMLMKYIVDDQREVSVKKKVGLEDLKKHYTSMYTTFMAFKPVIEDLGKQIRSAPDSAPDTTLDDIKNL